MLPPPVYKAALPSVSNTNLEVSMNGMGLLTPSLCSIWGEGVGDYCGLH